jgi:hypothetical protein
MSIIPSNEAKILADKKEAKRLYNKEWREKNKEALRLRDKEYREKNRDRILARESQYREENRVNRNEKSKEDYKKNKETISQKRKEYYQSNKELWKKRRELNSEKIKNQRKIYYEANKEKFREDRRQYYCNNKEKLVNASRIYRHANRGILYEKNKQRRKRLSIQNDKSITSEFITTLFSAINSCPYCGKEMPKNTKNTSDIKTLDHLIPLNKGGLHSRQNVTVCCFSCNSKKRDFDYPEWLNRLKEPYRTKAEKLYIKQYGVSPLQGVLSLTFT